MAWDTCSAWRVSICCCATRSIWHQIMWRTIYINAAIQVYTNSISICCPTRISWHRIVQWTIYTKVLTEVYSNINTISMAMLCKHSWRNQHERCIPALKTRTLSMDTVEGCRYSRRPRQYPLDMEEWTANEYAWFKIFQLFKIIAFAKCPVWDGCRTW